MCLISGCKRNRQERRAFICIYQNKYLILQTMKQVIVRDSELRKAAEKDMDDFLQVFIDRIKGSIGGEITTESMSELNSDQITLLAYDLLRTEVMDGGFVQLIYNGYGGFIFLNPFAKALKYWGMRDLSKLIYEAHTLYNKYREMIERDCSDDEFMALFEKCPEFDDLDDIFVENEEFYTEQVASYVDQHIDKFVTVEYDDM